jgi:flagellin FlaB
MNLVNHEFKGGRKTMLKKFMNRMHRDQKGITGLETAIILIAFVVVAAVFAFTALSAGLFSTEKSKQAVYSGLQETRSTMELRNGVTANRTLNANIQRSGGAALTTTANIVTSVQFMVANVMEGESIDLHPSYTGDAATGITPNTDPHTTVISLTDQNVQLSDCAWTVTWVGDENGDFSLDKNERALITVWLVNNVAGQYKLGAPGSTTFYSDTQDTAGNLIDTNHTFTIQVKPSSGAVLTVERTTPGYLDTVMDLH